MMEFNDLIKSFDELGDFLREITVDPVNKTARRFSGRHQEIFTHIIEKTEQKNPWFTPEFVKISLTGWSDLLRKEKLEAWLNSYPGITKQRGSKKIGLVLAGNIPMVGFHDLLSVVMSGHKALVKLSSKDDVILPAIKKVLVDMHPWFDSAIEFSDEYLQGMDAVIATGSDNASRYFDYYFSKYPYIIRKNRNSIAVLDGSETPEELDKLADDVFLYFGLGCRSVSKIWIPKGFDPVKIMDAFEKYKHLINHNKFANNHDYQKAILMVNGEKFLDNDFLVLREYSSISSPVATLHYQFYNQKEDVIKEIESNMAQIQCVVSKAEFVSGAVPFGLSQFPALDDYADGIDTISFLSDL